MAGRWPGLTPRVARHRAASALASALGLGLILQRGVRPSVLTWFAANLLILLDFVLLRRGMQLFLRIRVTDREHAVVIAIDALTLGLGLAAPNPAWAMVAVCGCVNAAFATR